MTEDLWTIQKLLDWTTDYFKKFNFEWPHLEAEILLAHALALPRIQLYVQHERILSKEELAKFKEMILRRSKHEPIAYITGIQPFMGLDFTVNPSVLIPRPETEKLVEVSIDIIKGSKVEGRRSLVDIGTGCGCIAISLVKYLPNISAIGIDSSAEAIEVAQENARKHKVEEQCQFIVGNIFATKTQRLEEFDIIVSNPPYIPTAEIEKLDPEIKNFEPRTALDGGEDGLDYINRLIQEGPKYLKENGYLILEFGIGQALNLSEAHGSGQAEKIKELAKDNFKEIKIIKDDSGKERVFLGYM